MIKNCLKFILAVAAYIVAFMVASGFMPYSKGFLEFSDLIIEQHPIALVAQLVNYAWICFTIYFIIKHTPYTGKKLFVRMFYVLFFTIFFITFLGAMYSDNAFEGKVTRLDFLFVMFTGLISLLVTIPLMIKLFGKKTEDTAIIEIRKLDIKTTAQILMFCGLLYMVVYFLFAFFVQWQFVEFRNFYSDTQWGQAAWGDDRSALFPWLSITFIRGVLNGLFVLPLLSMIAKNKRTFIIGLCLIYLAPAVNHVAPNPMFPDTVRLLHLTGMAGSMLFFGLIVGNILWKKTKNNG